MEVVPYFPGIYPLHHGQFGIRTRLAFEEFGSKAHTYSPAYTAQNFPAFLKYSSHITFNSLSQFERFYPMAKAYPEQVSCGIRVNPEYSEVEVELINLVHRVHVSV